MGMVPAHGGDDLMLPPWFAASERPSIPANGLMIEAFTLDKTDLLAWIKAGLPEGDPTDAPWPPISQGMEYW